MAVQCLNDVLVANALIAGNGQCRQAVRALCQAIFLQTMTYCFLFGRPVNFLCIITIVKVLVSPVLYVVPT